VSGAARPHLRALTGLRFVAAAHVLAFHSHWGDAPAPAFVRNIAGCGYTAVSLFFVLSGFILTYVHAQPGSRRMEGRQFYVSRLARIYPAYAFALALIGPFFVGHTIRTAGLVETLRQGIAVVALVQAFVPGWAMAWNPPGWSLSAEAFFYLLFPWAAAMLGSCRRSRAVVVGLACYALCLLIPLAYDRIAPDGLSLATPTSQTFWLNVLRYNPIVRFPEFVMGVVLGRCYLESEKTWLSGRRAALASWGAAAALAILFSNTPRIPYPLLHNGLPAPLFALLIVSLAQGRGAIASVLSTPPLVALGEASYSLYVLQVPLLVLWFKAQGHAGEPLHRAMQHEATFVIFVVVSSLLSHRYVEQPLRKAVVSALRTNG